MDAPPDFSLKDSIPPPSAPSSEPTETQREVYGQRLAVSFASREVHPVILIGTVSSGKSTLIASMLSYLRHAAHAGITPTLRTDVLADGSPLGAEAKGHAERFYAQAPVRFARGEAPPSTNLAGPVFIPIRLERADAVPVDIAFMESKGEWFQLRDDMAPSFRPEVRGFLSRFSKSITFIYFAPVIDSSGPDSPAGEYNVEAMQAADGEIHAAINTYRSVRHGRAADVHLLLATQWDRYKRMGFSYLDVLAKTELAADVSPFLAKYYPQSSAALNGLNDCRRERQRYSAGMITGRVVVDPKEDRAMNEAFQEYPWQLWNWLWSNATAAYGRDPDGGMFPQLQGSKPTILERIYRMLGARDEST